MRLLECVPNFSEGRDQSVIDAIVGKMGSVDGVQVLHVDMGHDANRTVVTLAGPPEAVVKAAFRGIKEASERIDMKRHRGAHPRMGSTDVCPLVPLDGISLEETVELAAELGKRVGRELDIPVYLYEESATRPHRRDLANIRSGEFEGLREKFLDPAWHPDFGPDQPHPHAGAVAIGARPFLLAFNVNLNTTSESLAKAIAADVRESGRILLKKGQPVLGEDGQPRRQPGDCRFVKAIGWYQESFGIAQVSMNLTNPAITPLHEAFDACRRRAAERGLRVTGSELIGMTPLHFLLDTGAYYLKKQGEFSDDEPFLVHIATRSLGLNDIRPFVPEKRIIEYRMRH